MKEQIIRLLIAIFIGVVLIFAVIALIFILHFLFDILGPKNFGILAIIIGVICTAIWAYKELGKP